MCIDINKFGRKIGLDNHQKNAIFAEFETIKSMKLIRTIRKSRVRTWLPYEEPCPFSEQHRRIFESRVFADHREESNLLSESAESRTEVGNFPRSNDTSGPEKPP